MQKILTDAERDEQGALYYAEKPFAVWRDAADGTALPYLVDQHTWHRGTDALRSASDWMRQAPGNRAIVYHRETGVVVAHYYQHPGEERGCLLFSLQGEVVRSSNGHLFEQGQWQTTRPVLPSTFIPETSDLTLPWSAYRSVRRRLSAALKKRGAQVEAKDRLADLLGHYHLQLLNTHSKYPKGPVGEVVVDPTQDYYDEAQLRECLLSLAPGFIRQSHIQGRWREKRVSWQMKEWGFFDGGWYIDVTDVEKAERANLPPSNVVSTIVHPDGGRIEIRTLDELTQASLDVLLWQLLFARHADIYTQGPEANDTFIEETLDLVVPTPDAYEQLRAMIDLEPRFFYDAPISPTGGVMSAARMVHVHLRQHIEHVYRENWGHLVDQTRQLTS